MKRMIMIALAFVLGLCLSMPGLAENADTGTNMLMGGWQTPADGTPTEETRDLLNRMPYLYAVRICTTELSTADFWL